MLGRLRYTIGLLSQSLEQKYTKKVFRTFSQYSEDILVDSILGCKASGTYVDVGANDPEKFNNTARFYRKGWHGINIEPNPLLLNRFRATRQRDINLNIGIGRTRSTLPFFTIDPNTLSTFDHAAVEQATKQGYRLASTNDIDVLPLCDVLDEHVAGAAIDFLSVDVEGFEMEVLGSNDWGRHRPKVVMIEVNRAVEEIQSFMIDHGYTDVFSNGTNTIYIDVRRGIGAAS